MKKYFFNILFSLFFLLAGFFIANNPAWAYQEINTDTAWKLADSPIIINDQVIIRAGAKLVIEPGVVIKFGIESGDYSKQIVNQGTLEAIGTKDRPIIFTSISDDVADGDTNGDGDATSPKPGDWYQISLGSGSQTTLENVKIRYGGYGYANVLDSFHASLSAKNIMVTDNSGGISNNEGQMAINNSSIYNNFIFYSPTNFFSAGVQNGGRPSHIQTVVANNNWWGGEAGPCPWQQLVPTGTPAWGVDFKAVCGNRPIIDSNVAYEPWLTEEPKDKLNPVIIIPGIMGSWPVAGRWEVDPILHTYDNLWEALKLAGYREGETLFALPYQWRYSNSYTALLLKDKIQQIKNICHCDKVDLIGHSMGGLIARAYIEDVGYANDVDKVIFLATPHRGATKDYLMWEGGETGVDLNSKILKRLFALEAELNGYGYVTKYIKELPVASVQELLPTYDYLRDKDSGNLRSYPNNYPRNYFLELLNNQVMLDKLHSVKIYNFVGDAGISSTVDTLRVVPKDNAFGEWTDGYPENFSALGGDHGLEYGPGDGTVPERSNSNFASSSDIVIYTDHGRIVTDAQKPVIKILTGHEPTQEVRNNFIINLLMVRIFSPADFVITAPDGKKLGKDFINNASINEIPGAFYSGFDAGPEFAVIPNPIDGQYGVDLQGTGQGNYRLSISSLGGDDQAVDQDFNGHIGLGQRQKFKINYMADSSMPLGQLSPQDTLPPVVTINSPTCSSTYWRRDKLVIDYSATDDFMGVSATVLEIEGQTISTSTVDLAGYAVGGYLLKITATDGVGNISEQSVIFQIITNLPMAISDLQTILQQKKIPTISALLMIGDLKVLQARLKIIDGLIVLAQKARNDLINNLKINSVIKDKLLAEADQKIAQLQEQRNKAIAEQLGLVDQELSSLQQRGLINNFDYVIIKANNNYLKNNL
ncbi:MAG: alpha/beta hydrolase [Patescibacteria group bacterium]